MEENVISRKKPYSREAEQAVIGAMMMEREAIIAAEDGLTAGDFYDPSLGVMFDAIRELYQQGKEVDIITLADKLKEKEIAPELCGLENLRNIQEATPTSANVRYYIDIVSDKAHMRRILKTLEDLSATIYQDKEPLENLLATTEKQVFEVLKNKNSGDIEEIRNIVFRTLKNIQNAANSRGGITGVATGFKDLDQKLAGLQKSDLILIAARPSMGKTAFVCNIADYVAVRSHVTTYIFSLEMSKEQLMNRMLAMESRVSAGKIRTGDLKGDEWVNLMNSAKDLADSGLLIDDTPGISVAALRSLCRKAKLEKNLGLVIIDYLQLMTGSGRSESRQNEVSEISRSLKALARELDCPVIALSQLSRAVEQRDNKRPMLSDLRESGAIEQDADVCMFIYRDEYYTREKCEEPGVAEIIVAKQRNGSIGTVKLKWMPELTKFGNLENYKVEE